MITANLQIDLIRGRFLTLNKERIERTQALMPVSQRDLLDLLPLLFHLNIPELPGFIDDQTPSGVFSFILDDKLYETAQRHWGTFDSQKRGMWSYDVEAIFLMGSCGTIAFNRKSDFDVWLCYRPELNDNSLAQLTKKTERIERWFESIGMEVHFFLMNAIGFKSGSVVTLSSESSGTAQHHILLDEFYRSSIWLAGKTPFWWYVPPENETSYDEVHEELTKNKIISKKETIDFGGLPDIPTSEFFGAAVWQIYKGIDSPYKSILKITLMESYAGSYPKTTPLSAEFKQKIYDGIEDFEALDPYLSMLHRIETHLINIMESNRLEVIRRSFYLKLNISLSSTSDKNNWRRKLIENLVASWSWAPENIAHLDDQKNWR
ncbi:MAG: class I adenylate cyclase [Robiginitomaculum sp.]|nr:class I adenylate cyclase [Robiginitomaculum sp.]